MKIKSFGYWRIAGPELSEETSDGVGQGYLEGVELKVGEYFE